MGRKTLFLFFLLLVLFSIVSTKMMEQKLSHRQKDGVNQFEETTTEKKEEQEVQEEPVKEEPVKEETRNSDAIRVAINTTGYGSLIHETIRITSDDTYIVKSSDSSVQWDRGKVLILNPDSAMFQDGDVSIIPKGKGKIQFLSVERSYGNPIYRGSMTIKKVDGGLCIVNELPLEEYLYSVVPSEMPVSFGEDALKVQAICARTYAYNQRNGGGYLKYGADVDDSVSCQVYNNVEENKASIKAVQATYGLSIYSGDEVITAYFYSTSSGYTSNQKDVWIEKGKSPKYLTGSMQGKKKKKLNLTDEKNFKKFIDSPEKYSLFEEEEPWFRWRVELSFKEIKQSIEKNLKKRITVNNSLILVKNKDGTYEEKLLSTIGDVKSVKVMKRGVGGVGKELLIIGSKETIKVIGEYNIRLLLAPGNASIIRQDGTKVKYLSMLPSGYFYTKANKTGVSIIGGGFGHGVGMSQNGVKKMCDLGYDTEEIIKHYYKGVELKNIYK